MSDFVKLLRTSQAPAPGGDAPSSDPFGRVPSQIAGAPSGPLNMPAYKLEFRAQRFMVGKELVGFDEGGKIFDDRDDVEALAEVQNDILAGKAVQGKRLESILSDGTVVVWLEWYTYAGGDTERAPNTLTEEELRSPLRVTPRSQERDAAADAAAAARREMDEPPQELEPETDDERRSREANGEDAW